MTVVPGWAPSRAAAPSLRAGLPSDFRAARWSRAEVAGRGSRGTFRLAALPLVTSPDRGFAAATGCLGILRTPRACRIPGSPCPGRQALRRLSRTASESHRCRCVSIGATPMSLAASTAAARKRTSAALAPGCGPRSRWFPRSGQPAVRRADDGARPARERQRTRSPRDHRKCPLARRLPEPDKSEGKPARRAGAAARNGAQPATHLVLGTAPARERTSHHHRRRPASRRRHQAQPADHRIWPLFRPPAVSRTATLGRWSPACSHDMQDSGITFPARQARRR